MNKESFSKLTHNQQIVFTAMMLDSKYIPSFMDEEISNANNIGKVIKDMFDKKLFTRMKLDENQIISIE